MFRKILVPLDGSELAEGILPYVSQLASGLDGTLMLLLVADPHVLELAEGLVQARQEGEVPGEAREYVAGVAERLRAQGVGVETTIAVGRPAEEIVSVAKRQGCRLIAMSTHGRTELGRAILGSVTDKVVHSSHLPVLTITPERAGAYSQADAPLSRVLVPLDGSPLAETVLPFVKRLAGALSLDVTLVRVAQLASVAKPYSATLLAYGDHVDVDLKVQEKCRDYLSVTAERLRGEGLQVTWRLLTGPAAIGINELAREVPQDMIVMATHGRSGVARWVLGSVTEAIVRSSGDPVLIVPASGQE